MTDRTPRSGAPARRPAPGQRPRPASMPPQRPDSAPRKNNGKKKKKKSKGFVIMKKIFSAIVTTLLSLFLIMVITSTIVATALTIYVLDFMEDSTSITLAELESGSDTHFYGTKLNENGEVEPVLLKTIQTDVQRIPVTIDKVPQHVRNAFVYTEDERFYVHDGVDYKRTFSAFLNMFLHFYDTEQGGSTITQQLIKNLTGDDEPSPARKIREIFAAMQLEKTYSKDEILEEYLNYIGFGGEINGIQLASTRYFGKNVEELTVPEAAVLAAIPQSPQYYGPKIEEKDEEGNIILDGEANNKTRQRYVLWQLYKNGAITYDDYQEYLNTKILYTFSPEYKELHPEIDLQEMESEQNAFTWELDALVREATDIFMKEFNLEDEDEARKRVYKGGYNIYSTTDPEMQAYVEEKFLDINNIVDENFVKRWADLDGDGQAEEQLPHIAFVALRYDGSVMCQVGALGPKTTSLSTNYATREPRQIGSTMKPISTYGLALESDHIHWGSSYKNEPIMTVNDKPWPTNYTVDSSISSFGGSYNIYYMLQQSFNTCPAKLCQELTPKAVFKFSTEKLGMKLDPDDEDYSPLTVGALTWGITLENLVNAYLPYGNQGIYNEAHIISRIEDANHKVIYSNDGNAREAVSAETAWVMNRLLKNVIDHGTGYNARLNNKVLVGKTGTTDNWYDLTFVGLTRDFASGITIGYREYNDNLKLPTSLHSADIWKNIIGEYADTHFADTPADFERVDSVIDGPMCTATGCIAGPNCPKGVTGYWKSTNAPTCPGHGSAPSSNEDPTEGGGDGNGDNNGGNAGGDNGNANAGGGDNGNANAGGDNGGANAGGGDNGGANAGGGDNGGGNAGGGDAPAPPADGGGEAQ
ncbi:MAG: transglycosylase domain-containing protein [Ruminococcus sp.]|nr:transglycosylase domain-containing protein [Ruminococcus sp.]